MDPRFVSGNSNDRVVPSQIIYPNQKLPEQAAQSQSQPAPAPSVVVVPNANSIVVNERRNSLGVVKKFSDLMIAVGESEKKLLESCGIQHSHPSLLFRISILVIFLQIMVLAVYLVMCPTVWPWYIFPIYLGNLIISLVYGMGVKGKSIGKKSVYLHGLFVFHTSLLLIIINTNSNIVAVFPWCMYPIAVMWFALTIHWMIFFCMKCLQPILLHLLFFVYVNVVLFVTNCYTTRFPFFMIIFVIWMFCFIFHFLIEVVLVRAVIYAIKNKKQKEASQNNSPSINSQEPAQPQNVVNKRNSEISSDSSLRREDEEYVQQTRVFSMPSQSVESLTPNEFQTEGYDNDPFQT